MNLHDSGFTQTFTSLLKQTASRVQDEKTDHERWGREGRKVSWVSHLVGVLMEEHDEEAFIRDRPI